MPGLERLAQKRIRDYDSAIQKAEEQRIAIINDKNLQLEIVDAEIERLKAVKNNQLSGVLQRLALYIGIFLGIVVVKYITK